MGSVSGRKAGPTGLVGLLAVALAGCGGAAGTSVSAGASVSAGPAASGAALGCQLSSGMSRRVVTAHYVMVLDLGPVEQMYTPAEVAKDHPSSGEVMLGGQMVNLPGMSMSGSGGMSGSAGMSGSGSMSGSTSSSPSMSGAGASSAGGTALSRYRHLEVHICSRATGAVVQGADPTITVVDNTAGNMTTRVPVAVMEGVQAGAQDYHYGNNVIMPPGRQYTITVQLGADTGVFHLYRRG